MAAEKRSVSGPEELFKKADARAAELGYTKFSEYVQALIRADTVLGGEHVRQPTPHETRTASLKKKVAEAWEAKKKGHSARSG